MIGRFVLLLAMSVLAIPRALSAQDSSAPRITELRAGFDGRFKVGHWAPFEVVIQGGSESTRGTVEMVVLDGDGVPSRVRASEPTQLDPRESRSVHLYAKVGRLASDIDVSLVGETGVLAAARWATNHGQTVRILQSGEELLVAIGSPLAAADITQLDQRRTRVADISNLSQLPTRWLGYEGVDAVIVATSDPDISSQLSADSPQLAALEHWVSLGGRLVLCVASQAPKLLDSSSPLARLAPGRFDTNVTLRLGTMLETYAEAAELLNAGGPLALNVAQLRDVRGKIEAYAGNRSRDLPLVVRTPQGFGEVVFCAFDLDRPPLAGWKGRPQLFEKLLRNTKKGRAEADSGTLGQLTTLGFVDLAGQLRGALDQFAGVQLVPFWLVAVLILTYIALIGPLDYWLVKKVFRRPALTWITFASSVILFAGGAYALAYGLKGQSLRLNQVDVVDFDGQNRLVRGTSWANIFSPRTEKYDLAFEPPAALAATGQADTVLSWFGLTGDGFGGMNSRSGAARVFVEPYDFSPQLDRLTGVPIAVWSTKPLVARWSSRAPGPIEAQLSDKNGQLAGTITSRLDGPLTHSVLIYGRWAYPLRKLSPGQTVDFESIDFQTVETFARQVTVQTDRTVSSPYDPASFDVPRIVEIMSLDELTGGENYTTLSNQYQKFVDLSGVVNNGGAILIGRKAGRAARLLRDGAELADDQAQAWTFYRFVFPVAPQP